MKKLILTTVLSALVFLPAQGQFLKKLQKKVEQRVENAITEKIAQKAEQEASRHMDNLLNTQFKNSGMSLGMEQVDPADIPSSYDFDWEYSLDMRTAEGNMEMTYLLKQGAEYVGVRIPQAENMITVLDSRNEMTVMYMNSDEANFVMANSFSLEESETEETDQLYNEGNFKKTDTKTILGYKCQGYQMDTEEHTIDFYVTDEAGVGFADLYNQANRKNMPKDFDADWLKDGNALMMEMQIMDKKNPKQNMSMTCTKVEKKDFSIKTADYQSLGGKK